MEARGRNTQTHAIHKNLDLESDYMLDTGTITAIESGFQTTAGGKN